MTIPKRYISLLVLLASVPMAAWVMAYKPINSAVAETASEIRVHTSRLANFPELNGQYRDMISMVSDIEEATETALKSIPETPEAEDWLEQVSDIAQAHALTMKSVTTSGSKERGEYGIMPIDLSVAGSFESVYAFIQSLEQMNRLSRIERMTIHRESVNRLDVRFVIHLIFHRQEEQE